MARLLLALERTHTQSSSLLVCNSRQMFLIDTLHDCRTGRSVTNGMSVREDFFDAIGVKCTILCGNNKETNGFSSEVGIN